MDRAKRTASVYIGEAIKHQHYKPSPCTGYCCSSALVDTQKTITDPCILIKIWFSKYIVAVTRIEMETLKSYIRPGNAEVKHFGGRIFRKHVSIYLVYLIVYEDTHQELCFNFLLLEIL